MHDRTSRGALTTTDVDASARDGAPSRVDRYVVHGELGRGGFGTVYAVTDERSGEHVALKVVRLDDPAVDQVERAGRHHADRGDLVVDEVGHLL